ncbi:MAG: hypothetical protein SFV54_14365 [Bryobacteraceae bacterium]|nr:hypothetical protein [Bryobacteraceae bacterium]
MKTASLFLMLLSLTLALLVPVTVHASFLAQPAPAWEPVQGLAALFSAVAAIAAAWVGWLAYQLSKEMKSIAREQQASARAQAEEASRQTENQRRALDTETFFQVFEFMERVRPDRALIRNLYGEWKASGQGDEELHVAYDKVARAFDTLGLLQRKGLVRADLVREFYVAPLVILWEKYGLREFVALEREADRRGATHLYELVEFYNRVKQDASKHPTQTGAAWPS